MALKAERVIEVNMTSSGIKRTSKNLKRFETQTERATTQLEKFKLRFAQVARALLSFLIMRTIYFQLVNLFKVLIGVNAQLETYTKQLEVVTGSALRAASAMEYLKRFAIETPFVMTDLMQGAIRLQAFGIEIQSYTKAVGDWASAMGVTFHEMAVRFGRVVMGTGQTVRLLGTMGIKITEFREELRKTGDRAEALSRVIERKFGGMMVTISHTFQGLISNIQDAFILIAAEVGEDMFKALKIDVKEFHDYLRRLYDDKDRLREWGKTFTDIYDVVRFLVVGFIDLVKIIKTLTETFYLIPIGIFMVMYKSVSFLIGGFEALIARTRAYSISTALAAQKASVYSVGLVTAGYSTEALTGATTRLTKATITATAAWKAFLASINWIALILAGIVMLVSKWKMEADKTAREHERIRKAIEETEEILKRFEKREFALVGPQIEALELALKGINEQMDTLAQKHMGTVSVMPSVVTSEQFQTELERLLINDQQYQSLKLQREQIEYILQRSKELTAENRQQAEIQQDIKEDLERIATFREWDATGAKYTGYIKEELQLRKEIAGVEQRISMLRSAFTHQQTPEIEQLESKLKRLNVQLNIAQKNQASTTEERMNELILLYRQVEAMDAYVGQVADLLEIQKAITDELRWRAEQEERLKTRPIPFPEGQKIPTGEMERARDILQDMQRVNTVLYEGIMLFGSAFEHVVTGVLSGTVKMKDALKKFAENVLAMLAGIIARMITLAILFKAFGMPIGGIKGAFQMAVGIPYSEIDMGSNKMPMSPTGGRDFGGATTKTSINIYGDVWDYNDFVDKVAKAGHELQLRTA